MQKSRNLSLNLRGYLMNLDIPKVMGILNVTPDSFHAESRKQTITEIKLSVQKMIENGVDIIDVGGCSTRPGYQLPSQEEEWERVMTGCSLVREMAPDITLSVDTFRSKIAEKVIDHFKADIINDISGGKDPDMWNLIAHKKVNYVLTHNPEEQNYKDITAETITWLSKRVNELHRLGVNDVIIDPGFGFAKTLDDNFILLNELDEISFMDLPLLVGLSRKSMIYKTLGCTPNDALTGSIALNAIALTKGANILRVHDIKEAAETVRLFSKLKESTL